MARGKEEKPRLDYGAELRRLRAEGPARLYMLRGEEDYLRDSYLAELSRLCVEEGTEAFNHHRFRGPGLDMEAFRDAVEAMPFLGERTLVEVRDLDINKTSGYDPELLKSILTDLPDWATVVFLFGPGYSPDGKLTAVKTIRKAGVDLEFTSPGEGDMIKWVRKRAEALGKRIDGGTASYLLWVCGSRMNTLIPEITKICGAAAGEEIARADIDAVAKRAPETTIFMLTDALGARQYDKAASLLADLLADRDEPPQKQIYMVSESFRRLFAMKTAMDFGKPDSFFTDCVPEAGGRPYLLRQYKNACRNYSRERLARAVRLCVECDFGMKDNGPDPEELMKELLLRLALDPA